MSPIKGRSAAFAIIGLALAGAVSLSACGQQQRIGPNPSFTFVDDQNTSAASTDEPAPAPTLEASPTSDPVLLYSNSNTGPVKVGATAPTTFAVVSGSVRVVEVVTYHYVEPKGLASTGDVTITGAGGKLYGLWTTYGMTGQDGVRNASWIATTDVVLPPGTYTITDSAPSTWS